MRKTFSHAIYLKKYKFYLGGIQIIINDIEPSTYAKVHALRIIWPQKINNSTTELRMSEWKKVLADGLEPWRKENIKKTKDYQKEGEEIYEAIFEAAKSVKETKESE